MLQKDVLKTYNSSAIPEKTQKFNTMTQQTPIIALIGGTGFIGQAVSKVLRGQGYKVRLLARKQPSKLEAGEEFIQADTSHLPTIAPALEGCSCAVHLVAVLAERGGSFQDVIYRGATHSAQAARHAGVHHMVYVSALGANTLSPSAYSRAKGLAEQAVRQSFPKASIIRPSLVMGSGGGFVQQVELLTRYSPFMILPGYGKTRFQPVEVEVVAQAIADACHNPDLKGKTWCLTGPEILTFKQLASRELVKLNRKRIYIPLPWSLTWLVAYLMAALDKLTFYRLLPGWLLVTPDQVRLLRKDNIAQVKE